MPLNRMSRSNVLELMRMTIYVFFPVAIFYYFNSPGYFDQKVEKKRREIFPKGYKPPLSIEDNSKVFEEMKRKKREAKQSNTASSTV